MHSKTPWKLFNKLTGTHKTIAIFDTDGREIIGWMGFDMDLKNMEKVANGKRLVSAVNACDGLSTRALEAGVVQEMVEWFRNVSNGGDFQKVSIKSILTKLEGKNE